MAYSGAPQAKQVREVLGKALATLQLDPSIPPQGVEVASFMAQAVGSLFVAENAPDDTVGRYLVDMVFPEAGDWTLEFGLQQLEVIPTDQSTVTVGGSVDGIATSTAAMGADSSDCG